MGVDENTLRKAKELEEKQKREFLNRRWELINETSSIDYDKLPTIDSSQSWIDKILRKLGLQRIR